MADPTTLPPEETEPAAEAADGDAPWSPEAPPRWSQSWQLPVLLLDLTLLGLWCWMEISSGREKNDFPAGLDAVSQYLLANNLPEAQARLEKIRPVIGEASDAERARFTLLDGDAIYLAQRAGGLELPEPYRAVIKLYRDARGAGQPLDLLHLQRLAECHIALGEDAEALRVLDDLANEPAETRYSLIRQLLERRQSVRDAEPASLAPLIARFEEEVRGETQVVKRRAQDLWIAGLQADLLLDAGAPQNAVDFLLVRMQSLRPGGDGDLAALMVKLGQAFQRVNENAKAERWYTYARERLPRDDALNATVLVGLAEIDVAERGDFREALGKFSQAESEFPASHAPVYFDALVGRADCEAHLGSHADAIEHFGRAVELLMRERPRSDGHADRLSNALRAHYELNTDKGEAALALDYLSLFLPLHRDQKELPAPLLSDLAGTHERIGEQRLAAGLTAPAAPAAAPEPADAAAATRPATVSAAAPPVDATAGPSRPLLFQQAAIHFGKAAELYRRHAHAVSATNDEAYGSSLWKAATNFDRAQLWKDAIAVYAEFVSTRPNDPRKLAALNHLGLAYKAEGQFGPAADLFKQLIEEHARSPEAYASLVPLAQCHVQLNELDAAERVLLHVVASHPAITPESEPYRRALIELGKLYYGQEKFERAAERLGEAVERYGESDEGPTLRFRLADSYRRSVPGLDKLIAEPGPQSRKLELEKERNRRLEQAMILYSQVVAGIENRPALPGAPGPAGIPGAGAGVRGRPSLSPLEALYYRNACFYRADCAFDMAQYETAIQLYDLAAKRWEDHPASLVALVQIVNAYCKLGRIQEARVANRRANSLFKRIPEKAWEDPSLPMSRQHWEEWLHWTSELDLFNPQASAAPASPSPP